MCVLMKNYVIHVMIDACNNSSNHEPPSPLFLHYLRNILHFFLIHIITVELNAKTNKEKPFSRHHLKAPC